VGVGLARGTSSVDFGVFGKIAASWVASIPAAGIGAVLLYLIFGLNETRFVISVSLILAAIMWILYQSIRSGPRVEIDFGGAE